jgi:hypothetical protein
MMIMFLIMVMILVAMDSDHRTNESHFFLIFSWITVFDGENLAYIYWKTIFYSIQ